jgi:hypothetical protein
MSNILHDQTTTNANGLPVVNRPCPPWCKLKTGHGWDSGTEGVDDGRGHGGPTVGDVEGTSTSVSFGNFETSVHGGPSTFSPVVIAVDSRPGGDELTPGQARQLAALLVLAAEQVEAL